MARQLVKVVKDNDAPERHHKAATEWVEAATKMADVPARDSYCLDKANLKRWWPLADIDKVMDAVS